MGLFDHFPYTNFHELNLDWMLNALRELEHTINDFVAINALKYADPIQWNITSQYEKNTIVIDPQTGTAYISVQPVPAGVSLTNTDYWTVVFDLAAFVVRAAKNLTSNYESETTLTATFNSAVNDWLIWGDTLYSVLSPINIGELYVDGVNIDHITIETVMGHIENLATADKSNIVAAVNELVTTAGDLNNLLTIDKSNLVAAINEVKSALETAFNSLSKSLNDYKIESPKMLNGNIIIDECHGHTEMLQGGCYIGNNTIVCYRSVELSDTGVLIAYDIVNKTILWQHNIKAYHGNSICYRAIDNKLYIAGCLDSNGNYINTIVVVSLADPSVVDSEITAPVPTVLSIAYDRDNDTFYSINNPGSVDGICNMMTKYEGLFDSIVDAIKLLEYPAVLYGCSTQAISLIENGIVYVMGYDMHDNCLVGNDIATGACVLKATFPRILNGYRGIGEVQNLIYNWDTDSYYVGSFQPYIGLYHKRACQIFEISLYKGVNPVIPKISSYIDGVYMGVSAAIYCSEDHLNDLLPYDAITVTKLKYPQDAIMFGVYTGFYTVAIMSYNIWLEALKLEDFMGEIAPGAGYSADISHVIIEGKSNVRFNNCNIINSYTFQNIDCNIAIDRAAVAEFNNCTFDDYTGSSATQVHIISYTRAKVAINNCTFNGSKLRWYRNSNAEIVTPDSYRYQGSVTPSYTSVANTYVYTGLSFTIPQGESWDVYMTTSYSTAKSTGLAISTNSGAYLAGLCAVYEIDGSADVRRSPIYHLEPGTYYVFDRRNSVSSGESVTLYKKISTIG